MTTRHERIVAGRNGNGRAGPAPLGRSRSEPGSAAPDEKLPEGVTSSNRAERLALLMGDDIILRTREAGAMLGVAVSTLEAWRAVGEGPPPVVINGRARGYRIGALREWVRRCERGSAEGTG
jgi:hypothetical protein